MSDALISRGWPVILLSAVAFAGDYALTVWGARLYRNSGAKDILQYEGSYELTSYYQTDIESGRWFSQRFVLALLVSAGLLTVLWWITVGIGLWPMLFAAGVGSVLLREVPVYLRHMQNISFFRHLGDLRVASGSHIEYPRALIYRLSATDMAVMAMAWLVLAALLESWFFLGGAIGSASVALTHVRQSRRHHPLEGP